MNSKKKKSNKHRSKKPNRRKKTPKVNQATDKPLGVEALPPSDSDTLSQVSVGSLDSKPIKSASKTTNGYKKGLLITIILGLLSPIVSVFIAYHPYLANGNFCATVNGNEVKSPVNRNCLICFDTDSVDLTGVDIFPQIKNDSRFPLKDVKLTYTIQSESADIDFTNYYEINKSRKIKEAINVDKTIYSYDDAPRPFEQFVMKDEGHAIIDLEATYTGAKNRFLYHSEIYAIKKSKVSAKRLFPLFVDHEASSLFSAKRFDDKYDLYILENDEVSFIKDCQYNALFEVLGEDNYEDIKICYDSLYADYSMIQEYDDTDSITPDFSIFDDMPSVSAMPIKYKIVIGVIIVSVICILGLIIWIRRVMSNRRVTSTSNRRFKAKKRFKASSQIKSKKQVEPCIIEGKANMDNVNIDNTILRTNSIELNKNKVKKALFLPVEPILFALLSYVSLYFILGILFKKSGWFWQGLVILSIAFVLWPVSRWIVNALSKNCSERFPKELVSISLWILLISIIALLFVFFI